MTKSTAIKLLAMVAMLAWTAAPALADGEGDTFADRHFSMRTDHSPGTKAASSVFETTPRASALIGAEVRSSENERLGVIDDLVMDREGKVTYIILSRGGVMGAGGDLVAVPASSAALKMGDEGRVIAGIDKSTIDSAPGFSRDNWPDFSGTEAGETVHGYFEQGSSMGKAKRRVSERNQGVDLEYLYRTP